MFGLLSKILGEFKSDESGITKPYYMYLFERLTGFKKTDYKVMTPQ